MAQTQATGEQKNLSAVSPAAQAGAPVAAGGKAAPNKRVLFVVALIALAALGTGGRMWYRSHYYVETDNAYVTGHVHPVSARVAGVVTRVLVDDNQMVKAGDTIAELDPADQRVRIEQIDAQIASVRQQVAQADAQFAQTRAQAQAAGAIVAMTTNFVMNNFLTYRDQRLRGFGVLRGLIMFYIVCSVGLLANVGVAFSVYDQEPIWWLAGMAGALMGVVWNYAMSGLFVWRKR